jgi:hypothetical protein
MPPMIEAMMPLRIAENLVVGSMLVSSEIRIPAIPAAAESGSRC